MPEWAAAAALLVGFLGMVGLEAVSEHKWGSSHCASHPADTKGSSGGAAAESGDVQLAASRTGSCAQDYELVAGHEHGSSSGASHIRVAAAQQVLAGLILHSGEHLFWQPPPCME